MADEIRRSSWVSIESSLIVNVPDSIIRLVSERNVANVQKTVRATAVGTGRFQIDQRNAEGVGRRRIVLEFTPDDKTKARVSGYSVLMFKVGEDWFPEDVQFALDELSKEVIIP